MAVSVVGLMASADVPGASPSSQGGPLGAHTPAVERQLAPTGTATPSVRAKATATPTAPVGPQEAPPAVAVGGDQPIGPQAPATAGDIQENVNVAPPFRTLQDTLVSEIDSYRAEVGDIEVAIAVTDLQTGQTISVSGNNPQRTACTINMFALFAAVGEFQAGRADPSDVAYNIKVGIGGSYPPLVKEFLDALFGDFGVGVARAREMMASWGMRASVFDHVPYYGDETQNNLLTALETNAVLSKLYRGELFSPEWTAYTLERLRDIKWGLNYILPGWLPYEATVAHKIGYYWDYDGWVNNDAGIVTFTGLDGQQKAYAITYLSQKAATEYTGYSFGARLSWIVWDWFEAAYGQGFGPPPEPSPEPTPTASPTQTAIPTSTPSPVPTSTPTPSPTLPASATPKPSPSPSHTPH